MAENKIDRFEHFTDDERYTLAEAVRAQLATKQKVWEELQAAPVESPTNFLTQNDLGIPALSALLDENGF